MNMRLAIFVTVYTRLYNMFTGGLRPQLEGRVYTALTTFQAMLADVMLYHCVERRTLDTAWAHYREVSRRQVRWGLDEYK